MEYLVELGRRPANTNLSFAFSFNSFVLGGDECGVTSSANVLAVVRMLGLSVVSNSQNREEHIPAAIQLSNDPKISFRGQRVR